MSRHEKEVQRLFVDGVALAAPLTGVGVYTSRLLAALLTRYPDLGLVVGAFRGESLDLAPLTSEMGRIELRRQPLMTRRAYRVLLASGAAPSIERMFPGKPCDAAFFPAFVTYPVASSVARLTIVHDATVRSQPADKAKWSRSGLAKLTQRSLDAGHCATVSQAAGKEISRFFEVRHPLDVLYPICSQALHTMPAERDDFVLCVGTASARKNVDIVLRAKAMVADRAPEVVVVGSGHVPGRDEGVRYLGFVDDAKLTQLMRRARAFIAPSFAEGFDLPVAEAVAAGTPVLASRIDVHEEVLGPDHPFFFDPREAASLAELLVRPALRSSDPELLSRFTSESVLRVAERLLGLG